MGAGFSKNSSGTGCCMSMSRVGRSTAIHGCNKFGHAGIRVGISVGIGSHFGVKTDVGNHVRSHGGPKIPKNSSCSLPLCSGLGG